MSSNLVSNLGSQTFNIFRPWPPIKSENGRIKFSNSVKLGDQILRSSKILTFAFTKVLLQNQPMCICFKITQSISAPKPTKVYLLQDQPKYICLLQNPPKYIHACEVIFLLKSLRNFVASFALLLHLLERFLCGKCLLFWTMVHRRPLFWSTTLQNLRNWCQNNRSFGKFDDKLVSKCLIFWQIWLVSKYLNYELWNWWRSTWSFGKFGYKYV